MLFSNRSRKGERRDGGKEDWKGWEIDKGCSLRLPLFFVAVSVGTRFRRLMAAGHVRGALKCRKGTRSFPINRPAGRETLARTPI